MSLAPDTEAPPGSATRDGSGAVSRADALVDELERRIRELQERNERDFGEFSRIDWLILVFGALIVPILLVIRFAP